VGGRSFVLPIALGGGKIARGHRQESHDTIHWINAEKWLAGVAFSSLMPNPGARFPGGNARHIFDQLLILLHLHVSDAEPLIFEIVISENFKLGLRILMVTLFPVKNDNSRHRTQNVDFEDLDVF
jgi:hypothetical protein